MNLILHNKRIEINIDFITNKKLSNEMKNYIGSTIHNSYKLRNYNENKFISEQIEEIMNKKGYLSLTYLSEIFDIDKTWLKKFFLDSNEFKESFIIDINGESVYRLNKQFGLIIDIWKTFCHINALKYQ